MLLAHMALYLARLWASIYQRLLSRPTVAAKYILKSGLFNYAWYLDQYRETDSRELRLIETYLHRTHSRSLHPLFDGIWYAGRHVDVAASRLGAAVHYLRVGAKQGRSPSPLFDGWCYQENNRDVALAGVNPLIHYLRHGWREGRDPHPLFDTAWYKDQIPALQPEMREHDPLTHYMTEGWRLGLSPHPLFDPLFYCRLYPEVAGLNPLLHYVLIGSHELRQADVLFDPRWYLQENPDVADAGLPPLLHYLRSGWKEKRSPMHLFDAAWYLEKYPDIAKARINPFLHYLRLGWAEKRSPHPLFDAKWYLKRYPNVAQAQLNPLLHYACIGWKEKHSPHPLFDGKWYAEQYSDVTQAGSEPLLHYLQIGCREARNPHPLFDAQWYLNRYPDVAKEGLDPLRHYLTSGWRENRNPGPFFNTSWYVSAYDYQGPESPLSHYLSLPQPNLRVPHPLFEANWYVDTYGQEIPVTENCYVDYVTNGIDAGRLPCPHFARVLDFLGETHGTRHEVVRGAFEKLHLIKGTEWEVNSQAEVQIGVLDTHYEIWKVPDSLEGKVVCLFVAFAPDGYLPRSTLYFLSALKRHDLKVILIAATQNSGRPYADDVIDCDGLISRDNFGFDFAGWALALNVMPTIWKADTIIFSNDSVFGPLSESAFVALLKRIRTSSADYLGLTESWQIEHHYQSYFFALKSAALRLPGVRTFWRDIRSFNEKDQVIQHYELKILEVMAYQGLKTEVLFPLFNHPAKADANPTLDNWRDLIKLDFPFIKVQVLRDDISGIDNSNWRREVVINKLWFRS